MREFCMRLRVKLEKAPEDVEKEVEAMMKEVCVSHLLHCRKLNFDTIRFAQTKASICT